MQHEDLCIRTERYALKLRKFLRCMAKIPIVFEDVKQLMRSSGSIAANFIEANEAHTQRERAYRIALCRKECKETLLWLRLIRSSIADDKNAIDPLIDECTQLFKIFCAISAKYKSIQ